MGVICRKQLSHIVTREAKRKEIKVKEHVAHRYIALCIYYALKRRTFLAKTFVYYVSSE